ncbi:hypothetical protein QAD02_016196 [Eretmocerus hayati]|uniref:Uncharacterized protein n=1 Tax=Eretmocerus hayati TaxID=131215 RepID=A0ACC2P9X4_9HYME|nr:hypothetical protein QAD02_016196 [Eretmocerus hayati]
MAEVSTRPISTKDMIIHAVAGLNERKGSNPIAIKKYLSDHYDLSQSRAVMITKLLRRAPDEGWLTQMSGSGASSGSYFKLSPEVRKMMQKTEAEESNKKEKEPQQSRAKTRASSETGKRRASKSAEKDLQAAKKKRAQSAKSPKEKATAKKKTG